MRKISPYATLGLGILLGYALQPPQIPTVDIPEDKLSIIEQEYGNLWDSPGANTPHITPWSAGSRGFPEFDSIPWTYELEPSTPHDAPKALPNLKPYLDNPFFGMESYLYRRFRDNLHPSRPDITIYDKDYKLELTLQDSDDKNLVHLYRNDFEKMVRMHIDGSLADLHSPTVLQDEFRKMDASNHIKKLMILLGYLSAQKNQNDLPLITPKPKTDIEL
jgi:hypothetical protein